MTTTRLLSLAGYLLLASPVWGQTETQPEQTHDESKPPEATGETRLLLAAALHKAGRFEACLLELKTGFEPNAKDGFNNPALVQRARLYQADSALRLGKIPLADAAIEALIMSGVDVPSVDSDSFSPELQGRFRLLRQKLADDAARESASVKVHSSARRPSRWIAAIPFGAGQFQNGDTVLGVTFLAGEVALLSTAAASALMLQRQESVASSADVDLSNLSRRNRKTETAYVVMTTSAWSFVGVALAGVLEAQLSLDRPLDEQSRTVSYAPSLSIHPGGTTLGLSGRFP